MLDVVNLIVQWFVKVHIEINKAYYGLVIPEERTEQYFVFMLSQMDAMTSFDSVFNNSLSSNNLFHVCVPTVSM